MTAALVLLEPFVRDGEASGFSKLLFRLALLRPWEPAAWRAYYKKLYPTRRDGRYDAHFTEAMGSLRKPSRWEAFRKTARTSHASVEVRLGEVHAPALVVMGSSDPDFADPRGDAQWIAGKLQAKVLMVPGAGHYPQAEFPDVVSPAVVSLSQEFKPTLS